MVTNEQSAFCPNCHKLRPYQTECCGEILGECGIFQIKCFGDKACETMPQVYLFFASVGRNVGGHHPWPSEGLQSKQVKSMFNWTGDFRTILAQLLCVVDEQVDGNLCLKRLNDLGLNDVAGKQSDFDPKLDCIHGDLTVDNAYLTTEEERTRAHRILRAFRDAAKKSKNFDAIKTFFMFRLGKAMPSSAGFPHEMGCLHSIGYVFPVRKHESTFGHIELKFSLQAPEAPEPSEQLFPWGKRLDRNRLNHIDKQYVWPASVVMEEYVVNFHIKHSANSGFPNSATAWLQLANKVGAEIDRNQHGPLICNLFRAEICQVPVNAPQLPHDNKRLALQLMNAHPAIPYYFQHDNRDKFSNKPAESHQAPKHQFDFPAYLVEWPEPDRPRIDTNPLIHCLEKQKQTPCRHKERCRERPGCIFGTRMSLCGATSQSYCS